MKLSVIIPVYNVAYTLDRCVASVMSTSWQDLEVILVDDGSTDQSPALCDQWSAKNTNIQVLHKANGGLSDARNKGIQLASGEYITFVDSDDYLEKGTLETVMRIIAQNPTYDIIEYPVNQHEGGLEEKLLTFKDKVYQNMSHYWYETKAFMHAYAWNKIYRKALFNNVLYPVGKVFEDIYILPLLLKATKTIATSSKGLYHYCYNKQSITANACSQEWQMLLDAHMRITKIPDSHPIMIFHIIIIWSIYNYMSMSYLARIQLLKTSLFIHWGIPNPY